MIVPTTFDKQLAQLCLREAFPVHDLDLLNAMATDGETGPVLEYCLAVGIAWAMATEERNTTHG